MNAANFRSVPNENNSSKGETRESRTMNIISTFNSGSWQQVGNVMRSFGKYDDEERIWSVRAASLAIALSKTLVYLRDKNEIEINVKTILESLEFQNFIRLVKRIEPPNNENEFLENMPEYLDSSPQQSNDFMETYGYPQMKFYDALYELNDDINWCCKDGRCQSLIDSCQRAL